MSREEDLKELRGNFNRVDNMLAKQLALVEVLRAESADRLGQIGKLQSENAELLRQNDKLRSENAELRLRLESGQGEPPTLQGD